MLPKDLLKYLEKRDDTMKDLKNASDLARYVNIATNSMWTVPSYWGVNSNAMLANIQSLNQQLDNQQGRP